MPIILIVPKSQPIISTLDVYWDPANKNSNITLSNGNLTATATNDGNKSFFANISKSIRKWYWEIITDSIGTGYNSFKGATPIATSNVNTYFGASGNGWAHVSGNDGTTARWSNGTQTLGWGLAGGNGTIFMVALDLDNGKIWVGKEGVWMESGDPVAGTNPMASGLSGEIYPGGGIYGNTFSITANFGATPFSYSPPTGFSAYNIE